MDEETPQELDPMNISQSAVIEPLHEANKTQSKGKEKVSYQYCFNEGGLLCQQALDSLGNGNLVAFSSWTHDCGRSVDGDGKV